MTGAPQLKPEADHAPQHDAGWTLVEMLIALVLLALISTLMVNALSGARKGLATLQDQTGVATVEAVQSHLRRALGATWPARPQLTTADAPLIEASSEVLQIVTAHSPAGQYGGLHVVEWALAPTARTGVFDLIESRAPYRVPSQPGTPDPARPRTQTTLLSEVSGLNLRYYGYRDAARATGWGGAWAEQANLPELMSVDISFPAGDRRKWPLLVVSVPTGR